MTTAQEVNSNGSSETIKMALSHQSTDKLKDFYDQWATDYDRDVSSEEYVAPEFIASFLAEVKCIEGVNMIDCSNRNINILDAGCGTGLVGVVLKRKGYLKVDGCDLSDKMVAQSHSTGAYRFLEGSVDLNKKNEVYKDSQFDAIICCGVFTSGHVPPTSLLELVRITKPGGCIVVSTRKSYYDSNSFQAVCNKFEEEKRIKTVKCLMDGPYLAEEGAHYFAFVVC